MRFRGAIGRSAGMAREQRDLEKTSRLEAAFAVVDVPDYGITDGAEHHDRCKVGS